GDPNGSVEPLVSALGCGRGRRLAGGGAGGIGAASTFAAAAEMASGVAFGLAAVGIGSAGALMLAMARRGQLVSSARPPGGASASPFTIVRAASGLTAAGFEPAPPINSDELIEAATRGTTGPARGRGGGPPGCAGAVSGSAAPGSAGRATGIARFIRRCNSR